MQLLEERAHDDDKLHSRRHDERARVHRFLNAARGGVEVPGAGVEEGEVHGARATPPQSIVHHRAKSPRLAVVAAAVEQEGEQ